MEAHGGFPIRKLFFLVVLLLSFDLAYGQDIFGSDTKAFVIMPAEVVSSGITKDAEVSDSGRWIIYQRQVTSSAENLITKKGAKEFFWFGYDRETKANNRLVLPKTASHIVVMGDNQNIYFEDTATKQASFYNIKSGTTTPVPSGDGYQLKYFGEKDFAPFLLFQKEGQSVIVYPNGKQSPLNHDASLAVDYPFGSDAQNLYFLGTVAKSKPAKVGRISVNRQSGIITFTELNQDELDKYFESLNNQIDAFNFEFRNNGMFISPSGDSTPNKTVIPKSARLCTTKDIFLIHPKHSLGIYQDSGALLIREIKRVDPKVAIRGIEDSLKEKAISEAETIAEGFLFFAIYNNNSMPSQETWIESILPYTNDRGLLNKFTYNFRGGDVSKLDGSKVELGFIMGFGGRAVAYVDGSVKWIPNP